MPEPIENQYFLMGHIARSNGVDGTVLIVPIPEAEDPGLFDEVELIYLQNGRGDLIPARIESVRVQQKDKRLSFFTKFEHIANRREAESLTGFPVLVAKDKASNMVSEKAGWISFEVFDDKKEYIGKVENMIENPAHPILDISIVRGNLLVPYVDEYIEAVDEENEAIYCKNLEQLKALQDDAD